MNLISKILLEAKRKNDNNIFQPRRIEGRRKPIDDFEAKMAKDFPIGSYAKVLLVYAGEPKYIEAQVKSKPEWNDLLGEITGMEIRVKLPAKLGPWSNNVTTAYWKSGTTNSYIAGTINEGHWQIGG